MPSMMDMGSKLGLEGVDTEASTGKVLGMDLESIGSIQGMFMLVNGQMARAMVVEFILVRMAAAMLVNSSGVSSMALATTILGMGIHMLENTLQTKCTDSECINLGMGIGMKEHGMRERGKALECTHLEMEKPKQGTGRMGYLTLPALRIMPPFLSHLLPLTILKYSMVSRKQEKQQRKRTI